jgi:hypothetical protein
MRGFQSVFYLRKRKLQTAQRPTLADLPDDE